SDLGNRFGDVTFNRKNVSQFAIERIRPNMGVIGCLDELHVYAHGVTTLLHASFHDMCDTQLLGYLTEVSRRTLVMLSRCARNYFQLGDLCETRENLILNAVSKVGVCFFFAPVFEWKHRDAFFRHNGGGRARSS